MATINNIKFYENQLKGIRAIFQNTQMKLLNLIANKKNITLSTFNEDIITERIDLILNDMLNKTYTIAPSLIEKMYRAGKLKYKYNNLRYDELAIVEKLTDDFLSKVTANAVKTKENLIKKYKEAEMDSNGYGVNKAVDIQSKYSELVQEQGGIICYKDNGGHKWSFQSYSDMIVRTSTRQANNYGVLFTYPHIDLYKISEHGSTCKICAPLEGRVYSRSGTHPIYPPLASAFGKINTSGSNDLTNTYLNIHPNCLHVLVPFLEEGKSEKELEEIQKFSNFETNPPKIDPRLKKEVDLYRKKEDGRSALLSDYKQYQNYKLSLGNEVPKTFSTFQKHKQNNSEQYKNWKSLYREKK